MNIFRNMYLEFSEETDSDYYPDHYGSFQKDIPEMGVYVDLWCPDLVYRKLDDRIETYPITDDLEFAKVTSLRYWVACNDHFGSWDHVDLKDKQAVIEKHGSLARAAVKYSTKDLQRLYDFEGMHWSAYHVSAEVIFKGSFIFPHAPNAYNTIHNVRVVVGHDSLGGIEDDGEYLKQVTNEVKLNALRCARTVLKLAPEWLPKVLINEADDYIFEIERLINIWEQNK